MKKITTILFGLIAMLIFAVPAYAQMKPVDVFINYRELKSDQPALLNTEKGRTYLPVRAVAETLGAEVHWVEEGDVEVDGKKLSEVHITVDERRKIIIPIGSEKTWIYNGFSYDLEEIDAPAFVTKDTHRTMVPLRYVGEMLGKDVEWLNNTVYIFDYDQPMGYDAYEYMKEKYGKENKNYKGKRLFESNLPLFTQTGRMYVKDIKFDQNYNNWPKLPVDIIQGRLDIVYPNTGVAPTLALVFIDQNNNFYIPYLHFSKEKEIDDGKFILEEKIGVFHSYQSIQPPPKFPIKEIFIRGMDSTYWIYKLD